MTQATIYNATHPKKETISTLSNHISESQESSLNIIPQSIRQIITMETSLSLKKNPRSWIPNSNPGIVLVKGSRANCYIYGLYRKLSNKRLVWVSRKFHVIRYQYFAAILSLLREAFKITTSTNFRFFIRMLIKRCPFHLCKV